MNGVAARNAAGGRLFDCPTCGQIAFPACVVGVGHMYVRCVGTVPHVTEATWLPPRLVRMAAEGSGRINALPHDAGRL
jgi:hypothetical protein